MEIALEVQFLPPPGEVLITKKTGQIHAPGKEARENQPWITLINCVNHQGGTTQSILSGKNTMSQAKLGQVFV